MAAIAMQDNSSLVDQFTVDKLKTLIRRCSDRLMLNLRISGNKAALLARVKEVLNKYKTDPVKNQILEQIIAEIQAENGLPASYIAARYNQLHPPAQSHTSPGQAHGTAGLPNTPNPARSKVWGSDWGASYPSKPQVRPPGTVWWDETPFFRVEKPISGVVICPESGAASHRTTQYLTFQLSEDARTKIQQSKSSKDQTRYQIRLYMTQYNESISSNHAKRAQVEFPPTCEAIVNSTQLTANLKGIKKQPGTATPPDITPLIHLDAGVLNRVEFRYINTLTKFVMVANLVEQTPVSKIVERLVEKNLLSSEEVEKNFKKEAQDSDLVATRSDLSLKCPLSHTRIATPSRSSTCAHAQCFDATSFFSLNEQIPAWSCPVCYKKIRHQDIIVDGFFQKILRKVGDHYDIVVLNEDFTWQTEDGKVRSNDQDAELASKDARNGEAAPPLDHESNKLQSTNTNANTKKRSDVFLLDDDDDDRLPPETSRPRKVSPSTLARREESLLKAAQPAPPALATSEPGQQSARLSWGLYLPPPPPTQSTIRPPQPPPQRQYETVDLTLSSDDEPDEPLANVMNGNRHGTSRPTGRPRENETNHAAYSRFRPAQSYSIGQSGGNVLSSIAGPSTPRQLINGTSTTSPRTFGRPIHQQYSPNGHSSSSQTRYTDPLWEAAVASMAYSPSGASRTNTLASTTTLGSPSWGSPSTSSMSNGRGQDSSFSPVAHRASSQTSLDSHRFGRNPGTSGQNSMDERPQTPEADPQPPRLTSSTRRRVIQDDDDGTADLPGPRRSADQPNEDITPFPPLDTSTLHTRGHEHQTNSLSSLSAIDKRPAGASVADAFDPDFVYNDIFGRDSVDTDDTVVGNIDSGPNERLEQSSGNASRSLDQIGVRGVLEDSTSPATRTSSPPLQANQPEARIPSVKSFWSNHSRQDYQPDGSLTPLSTDLSDVSGEGSDRRRTGISESQSRRLPSWARFY